MTYLRSRVSGSHSQEREAAETLTDKPTDKQNEMLVRTAIQLSLYQTGNPVL